MSANVIISRHRSAGNGGHHVCPSVAQNYLGFAGILVFAGLQDQDMANGNKTYREHIKAYRETVMVE